MTSLLSPARLSRRSAEHPWRTVLTWLGVLIIGFILNATLLESSLTTEFVFTNTPESKRGFDLIEDLRGDPISTTEVIVVRSGTHSVDDTEFQSFTERLYGDVAALGSEVIRDRTFVNHYQGIPGLVSDDRSTTIMPLTMAGDFDDATTNVSDIVKIVEERNGEEGFEVLITGGATGANDFEDLGQEDLERGEIFGIPIALVILVLVIGTVVAAFVPMIVAIISILIALGTTALIGQVFPMSFFVVNIIFMVGLAVGIDYSLFIVARYREERSGGLEKVDAIERAGDTASRAVLFSGMTVVLGLIGMLIIPFNVFIALGIGAIVVVVVSVAAALTLLPAAISLLDTKMDRLSIPLVNRAETHDDGDKAGGFWDSASHLVMRYPAVSLAIGVALLVAAALPTLNIETGFAGISTLPDDYQSKTAFEILDAEFSAGDANPAQIVIKGDLGSTGVQNGIDDLKSLMASDPNGVYGEPKALEISSDNTIALMEVSLAGDAAEDPAQNAVKRLRDEYVPDAFSGSGAEVVVTGVTANNLDFFSTAADAIWKVFPFVLGMSFILLMIVFRSIVVPVKAILLNLLSVAATYGLLVLFFQEGLGEDLGLFTQFDIIEAWIPLFLFTILFGLSMDYEVFLLSRIRERFDQTGDNTESIAFGIRSTGRLITGAALIMVAVFWGFAAGDLVGLQEMGFGLGIAILIDATLVRMVLVPSSMKLMGKWNWYLPEFMFWLPDIRVESSGEPESDAEPEPVVAGS